MQTDLEAAQTLLGPGLLRSAPGGPGQMASKGPGKGPTHGTPLCREIFYILADTLRVPKMLATAPSWP